MSSSAEEHRVVVKIRLDVDEWRPQCSCGWNGYYYGSDLKAEEAGERHVEEEAK